MPLSRDEVLGHGRGGQVTWDLIADVSGRSSRRVVVAEQTREGQPMSAGNVGVWCQS